MTVTTFVALMRNPKKVKTANQAWELGRMAARFGDAGIPDFSSEDLLDAFVRGLSA